MPLDKNNVIILYRNGDSASLSVAQRYKQLHGLATNQMVAVPCSTTEVLSSYSQFQTQVENAVQAYIDSDVRDVRAIVVGFNIPGGFEDGDDVVSTTSRLSRIGHTFSRNLPNPIFDRRAPRVMDEYDFAVAMPCMRLDGPTVNDVLAILDRTEVLMKQASINGMFYIDPYPVIDSAEAGAYRDDLLDFVDFTLPLTNLPLFMTTFIDAYLDLVIPYVKNDSFVWSCGADSSTDSFFRWSAAVRTFLYNADSDNAATMRDAQSTRWPSLALRNGYCATAGSMSGVTPSHHLRPRPFFECILGGGSLGEAMLLSTPHLDSPAAAFGDPLATFALPTVEVVPEKPDHAPTVDDIAQKVGEATASLYRARQTAVDLVATIVSMSDVETKVVMADVSQNLVDSMENAHSSALKKVATEGSFFMTERPNVLATEEEINAYLQANAITVPYMYAQAMLAGGVNVATSRQQTTGEWRHDFILEFPDTVTSTSFHFAISVSKNEDFDAAVMVNTSSDADPSHWYYEKEVGQFEGVPSSGVPSAFVGRRIRYKGSAVNGLTRGNLYFVRTRVIDGDTLYDWSDNTKMVVGT